MKQVVLKTKKAVQPHWLCLGKEQEEKDDDDGGRVVRLDFLRMHRVAGVPEGRQHRQCTAMWWDTGGCEEAS